jgi:cobalt-zinc-cadmium efflux system outer membrane protein
MTLREVFDSVRSNNPLLGAAKARVRAAYGGLSSARTWSNPIVSFESQQMSEQAPGMTTSQRETMTTATVPLEPFYQRGPRIKRAQALIRASEADVLTQRQQLAIRAAEVFYHVALAQVNVAATHSLAQWFDTVVTYNGVRVREGVAAEADLIRSELERDHVLNDLAMAESELARAQADLQTFVGSRSAAGALQVDVDSLPLNSAITAQADRVLHPEVEAARERLVASEAATGTERRMLLRDLAAMVGTKNSAGSSSLVAGFTLPFPLLDQNRGSIVAARAERDVAQSEFEQEKRNADAGLMGAERAARILSQRVATFGSGRVGYLARAEDARRIALGAYREGGTSLLQVIDAARAWKEARNSYFETLFAQHLAVIQLLVAEGIDVIGAWPPVRSGASK